MPDPATTDLLLEPYLAISANAIIYCVCFMIVFLRKSLFQELYTRANSSIWLESRKSITRRAKFSECLLPFLFIPYIYCVSPTEPFAAHIYLCIFIAELLLLLLRCTVSRKRQQEVKGTHTRNFSLPYLSI